MKVKVVGTGSNGNCYLLEDDQGNVLVIDAGMPIIEVKKALNFNIKCISGVFVSHMHSDHNRYAKEFEKMGFEVWKPYLDTSHKVLKKKIGNFELFSFDLPHDGCENRGVLIKCEGEKILYATDFEYCQYLFKNQSVEHFIVECNYIRDFVEIEADNYEHVLKGHCEMQTTLRLLKDNYTSNMQDVILCHLSSHNCDADILLEEAKKVINRPIYIAKNGIEIKLGCPF